MSLFSRITGTVSNLFNLGGPNGPLVKNNAGPPVSIDHRNATDTAFVIAQGADPNSGIGTGSDQNLVTQHSVQKSFHRTFLFMGG